MGVLAGVINPLAFIPAMWVGGFAWFQWQISTGRRERDFAFFIPAQHRKAGLALAALWAAGAIGVLAAGSGIA